MSARTRPRLREVPKLLCPGAKVFTEERGVREYGTVQLYEHYSATQNTFPVKFGQVWRAMRFDQVIVLPDAEQPPGLEPPTPVGNWYKNLPAPVLLPKHRNGSGEPATVVVAATSVA